MSQGRRNHSQTFKTKVAFEAEKGNETVAQLAARRPPAGPVASLATRTQISPAQSRGTDRSFPGGPMDDYNARVKEIVKVLDFVQLGGPARLNCELFAGRSQYNGPA